MADTADAKSERRSRVLVGLAMAGTVALAVVGARALDLGPDRLGLPMWDMAAHGVAGIHLADALHKLDLWRFGVEIYRMAGWPPGFALVECPVFLGFGPSLVAATRLVNVLFGLAIGAAFLAGVATGGSRGVAAGAVAAALLAASPIYQQFGTVVMLEMLGALLLLLGVAAYLAWARKLSLRAWKLVCASTVALFFVKYNYGLLWMAALSLAWGQDAGRESVRRWLVAARGRMRAPRPFDLFVACYLLFLVMILLTGGWSGTVTGRHISVRSIGNPLAVLVAICLLQELRNPHRAWRRVRGLFRGPSSEPRVFARIVLVPIGIWLLAPLHLREFANFLVNRPGEGGAAGWQGITFYLRSFAMDYTSSPQLGWVLLVVMALVCVRWRRLHAGERIVPIAFVVGLVATSLHRYKEPRFFFTVAPFVWIACGLALASLVERMRSGRTLVQGAIIAGALVLAGTAGFDRAAIERRHRALSVDPAARDVLDRIAEVAASEPGTALFGTGNGLSPGLVEWHLRLVAPRAVPPRGADAYARSRSPDALLSAVASDPRTETLLIVVPEGPSTAVIAAENPWLEPLCAVIRARPEFEWRADRRFDSGYRLEEWAVRHHRSGDPPEATRPPSSD